MSNSKSLKPRAAKSKEVDSDAAINAAKGATGSASKSSEAAQTAKAKAIVDKNTALQGLPEQIAKDKFKKVKHEWPGARQAYPQHKDKWYVDLFFPYAADGPLFIDQIKNTAQKAALADKAKVMKKLGHRYLQLDSNMDLTAALEQLA